MDHDSDGLFIGCIVNSNDVFFHPIIRTTENGTYTESFSFSEAILNCSELELLAVKELFKEYFFALRAYFNLFVDSDGNYPTPKRVLEKLLTLNLTQRERIEVQEEISKYTYIYLIKDNRTGFVKIGRSNTPEHRLNQLKKQDTLLPYSNDFELIYAWAAYPYIEKILHKKYETKRIRGEWFSLDFNDLLEIEKYYVNKD